MEAIIAALVVFAFLVIHLIFDEVRFRRDTEEMRFRTKLLKELAAEAKKRNEKNRNQR